MKISIIVPIYNVQKQLKRCIDSLLKQEDEKLNVQIILVNDGATDDSGKIAKAYYKKYNDKIIYLEKENGGLSDARNYGLKFIDSDSNYIAFVDSDDYISDKMYLKLLPYMEKEYDMVKIKVNQPTILGFGQENLLLFTQQQKKKWCLCQCQTPLNYLGKILKWKNIL